MNETILIAHPRPEEVQSLAKRATAAAENLTILRTDSFEKISAISLEHRCSILILDSSLCLTELSALPLPEDALLLLIVQPEQAEQYAEQLAALPWNFDFITGSVSSTELQQKINLFRTLQKVSQELAESQEQVLHLTKKVADIETALNSQQHYLDILAERDGLTGLYNRKHLTQILAQEFNSATLDQSELSLILLDIDHFNEINKTSGQKYGDFVLNDIAARLTSNCRQTDVCFRFGGGNFIILLPQSDIIDSSQVAEKLRKNCETKKFDNGKTSRQVTISVGIASLKESQPQTPDQLIHMADKALFQAKSEGRNRCQVFLAEENPDHMNNLTALQETLTRMMEKTRKSSLSSIELLARNLGGKHDQKHIRKTKKFLALFSQRLNLSESIQQTLNNSLTLSVCFRFLLHKDLINKKGPLTADERKVIKDIPYKLVELTQLFDYFLQERQILLYHREWYNGEGYPEGLGGDEIPVGAKIFNLADGLAAMITDRPYRKHLSPEKILQELEEGAGKQWDPQFVLILLDIIEQENILSLEDPLIAETRERLLNTLG